MLHLILLAALWLNNLHAEAQFCQLQVEIWSDQQALVKMQFPDGRQISMIGHNHGSSETAATLIPAVANKDLNNTDYLKSLNDLTKKNQSAITCAQREVDYVRQQFATDSDSVIALEATETGAKIQVGVGQYIDDMAAREFNRRQIDDPELRKRILLMLSGSTGYLATKEPDLIARHPIVGVDDPILEDFPAIWNQERDLAEAIKTADGPGSTVDADLTEFANALDLNYPVLEKYTDDQIVAPVLPKLSPKLRPLVEEWMRLELREARMLLQRDHHIVQSVLDQKHSTILFIGYAHLKSLAAKLQAECEKIGKPVEYPATPAPKSPDANR